MNNTVAYSLGVAVTAGTIITGSLWYNRPGSVVRAEDMAECWAAMHERIRIANHDCSDGRYTNGVPDGFVPYGGGASVSTTVVGVAGSYALFDELLTYTRGLASGYVGVQGSYSGGALPDTGLVLWAPTNDIPADGDVCMSGNFAWKPVSADGESPFYFVWTGPYGVTPTVMTLGTRWPGAGYVLSERDSGFARTNDLFAMGFYKDVYYPLAIAELFEAYDGGYWAPPGFDESWWNAASYWGGHRDVWPWLGMGTNSYRIPGGHYAYTNDVVYGERTGRVFGTNVFDSVQKFLSACTDRSVLVLDSFDWDDAMLFNTPSNTLEATYWADWSSFVSSNSYYQSWVEGSQRVPIYFDDIYGQARDELALTEYSGVWGGLPTLASIRTFWDYEHNEETYSSNGNRGEYWKVTAQHQITAARFENVKCAWPLDYAFSQGYVARYRVYATVYVPQAETMPISSGVLSYDHWDFTADPSEVNKYTSDDLSTGMALPDLPTGVGVNGPFAYTNLYVNPEDYSTAYRWRLLCDAVNPSSRPSFTLGTGSQPAIPDGEDLQAVDWTVQNDPPEPPQVGWYISDRMVSKAKYVSYVKLHRIIVVVDWNWKHLNDANPYSPTPHTPTWMTNTNAP